MTGRTNSLQIISRHLIRGVYADLQPFPKRMAKVKAFLSQKQIQAQDFLPPLEYTALNGMTKEFVDLVSLAQSRKLELDIFQQLSVLCRLSSLKQFVKPSLVSQMDLHVQVLIQSQLHPHALVSFCDRLQNDLNVRGETIGFVIKHLNDIDTAKELYKSSIKRNQPSLDAFLFVLNQHQMYDKVLEFAPLGSQLSLETHTEQLLALWRIDKARFWQHYSQDPFFIDYSRFFTLIPELKLDWNHSRFANRTMAQKLFYGFLEYKQYDKALECLNQVKPFEERLHTDFMDALVKANDTHLIAHLEHLWNDHFKHAKPEMCVQVFVDCIELEHFELAQKVLDFMLQFAIPLQERESQLIASLVSSNNSAFSSLLERRSLESDYYGFQN
ncbi:hypothetical protein EDD86DRAFT_204730, partial [Gorgonomyces haynaldii]